MRLAIAVALLANTLPAHSHRNKVKKHENRRQISESLFRAVTQNRFEGSSFGRQRNKHSGLGKKNFMQGGRLKNLPSTTSSEQAECDPDVGVLSCGYGQYCEASSASSKGGFCIPTPDKQQRGLLVELPSVDGINPGPTGYCDPGSDYYHYGTNMTIDCDCSEWNADNSTGTLSCSYANDCYCDNTCYGIDFVYTSSDEDNSFIYCYDFTKPYEQQFCFGTNEAQSCFISLDGTACSSCVENNRRLNCETGTCETESCFDFDCENIGLGTGNTCDQPVYPPAFGECYNSLPGYYDQCLVCPDSYVAYPDNLVRFPGYSYDYSCSYLFETGYTGYFNPSDCSETIALTSKVCCKQEPFVCNVCREEGSSITKPDALVEIPGRPARTCGSIQESATLGAIPENECGPLQGFVRDKCGCSDQEGIVG